MRAVIFDLGGVVFHYSPEVRWRKFAALTGEAPIEVRKRLSDSGYSQSCDAGRLKGERAYAAGVDLLGTRLSLERFCDIWVSVFTPNAEVIDIARKLKRRCSIALLTNNSDLVRLGLERRFASELELFRPRLFSADFGLLKPDPRLFTRALDIVGVKPEDALLVDDASKNTDTAGAFGMPAHHYSDPATLSAHLRGLGLL